MAQKQRARSKSERGFRRMSKKRRIEIASAGGKAAHAAGTAHQFTSEEAKRAGRLGGKARSRKAKMARNRR